jgi:hypothetical protein
VGHSLFLCSVSLLACPSMGQIVESQPAPGCASCQAAQQMRQMPMQPMPMQYQDAPPPSRGPLGLGLWDKMFHRNEDAEPKPGIFVRMQYRINSWFVRPQAEMSPPIASGCASGNCGHPYVNIEPPIGAQPNPGMAMPSTRPYVSFGNSEPPIGESTTIPASYGPESMTTIPGAVSPDSSTTMPATYRPETLPTVNKLIAPKNVSEGHESDYSWVTGHIAFANGAWYIQYTTPGAVDQFGGKLKLANIDPNGLHDGDFVCVTGALMSANGEVISAYRVTSISLFEGAR